MAVWRRCLLGETAGRRASPTHLGDAPALAPCHPANSALAVQRRGDHDPRAPQNMCVDHRRRHITVPQ